MTCEHKWSAMVGFPRKLRCKRCKCIAQRKDDGSITPYACEVCGETNAQQIYRPGKAYKEAERPRCQNHKHAL